MAPRSALALPAISLLVAACFNGDEALGLQCQNDAQCGTNLACVKTSPDEPTGICGGVQQSSTGSSSTGSSTGDSETTTVGTPTCGRSLPAWCQGVTPLSSPRFDQQVYESVPDVDGDLAVAVGYFLDDDDRVDIAVANLYETNVVLHHNVEGAFERDSVAYPLTFSPYDLDAADFDCDGNTDLAAVGLDASDLVIAYGTGLGLEQFVRQATVAEAWSLAVGDFLDDDGRPELIAGGSDRAFLFGSSDRSWSEEASISLGEAIPWSIAVGDIDGDGLADAAIPDSDQYDYPQTTPDRVILLSGEGLVTLSDYQSAAFVHPIDAALLDIDGDDDLDLAVLSKHIDADQTTSSQPATLSLHENDGAGGFAQIGSDSTLAVGGNALVAADFDCDGDQDLAAGFDGADGGVWVLWGPDYNAAEALQIADGAVVGTRMAVADFDADGYPDLAVSDFGTEDEEGIVVDPSALYVLYPRNG